MATIKVPNLFGMKTSVGLLLFSVLLFSTACWHHLTHFRSFEDPSSPDATKGNHLPQSARYLRSTILSPDDSKIDSSQKYLSFFPGGGSSNQLSGVRKAFALAARYNRTLILPPLSSSHIRTSGKFVARSEMFTLVRVNVHELNKTEAYFDTWFQVREGFPPTITMQQFIHQTGQTQFMCKNAVKPAVNVATLDENPEWIDALEKHDVLCVGNPWHIKIAAKPLMEYIQFSKTVRSVGDDWMKSMFSNAAIADNASPATQSAVNHRFIATHIRRGDFVRWCQRRKFADCYLEYPDMFQQMNKFAESFLQSSYLQEIDQVTQTPPGTPLPIFFATNEEDQSQLQALHDLGWKRFSAMDYPPAKQALIDRGSQIGLPSIRDLSSAELGLLDIFVDQYICTQAAFFVRNSRSTFSRVIYDARDCSRDNCRAWGKSNTALLPASVVTP